MSESVLLSLTLNYSASPLKTYREEVLVLPSSSSSTRGCSMFKAPTMLMPHWHVGDFAKDRMSTGHSTRYSLLCPLSAGFVSYPACRWKKSFGIWDAKWQIYINSCSGLGKNYYFPLCHWLLICKQEVRRYRTKFCTLTLHIDIRCLIVPLLDFEVHHFFILICTGKTLYGPYHDTWFTPHYQNGEWAGFAETQKATPGTRGWGLVLIRGCRQYK